MLSNIYISWENVHVYGTYKKWCTLNLTLSFLLNIHFYSPLGALQLDLYTRQVGPIVYNAPENSICVGKLHLRVTYDSKCSDLAVHLIEAHNLVPSDENGFREVYVRLEIKPEIDQRKRETNIFRFDTNPYFNQHFKFPISRDQLQLTETELILLVSYSQ